MAKNPDLSGNFGPTTPGRDSRADHAAATARIFRWRRSPSAAVRMVPAVRHAHHVLLRVRSATPTSAAGETLIVMAIRVHDTGTDATNLEAYI